jgi:hypothetical protein
MKTSFIVRSLLCLTFFSCSAAVAALPPTAESFRRIKTILDSVEVYDTLGSANWIKSITENDNGYVLKSEKCSLQVQVEAIHNNQAPGFVGPAPLQVKIGKLDCK